MEPSKSQDQTPVALTELPGDALEHILQALPSAVDLNHLRVTCSCLRNFVDANPQLFHFKIPIRFGLGAPAVPSGGKDDQISDLLVGMAGVTILRPYEARRF
eukprot:TRINITY_DN7029_c0_g1_i1.p1 TRINITY_DN7029_c0_g1~~TRINITY_DN7029_c0_g1_i1.p1  ORF type:complete len:102 (-),score=9.13 TRINITY_DN7029_c0_g1_i1:119-424(-)